MEALEALPDLTLSEAAARWGVGSNNTIKARAAALGVELRRESPTRTVWPAEHVALGDRLADHLKRPGATLASFPEALPSVPAPTAGSREDPQAVPMPGATPRGPRKRSGDLALTAPTAGTDGLAALAQLAAAMAPPAPPPDPLAVARGLAEAADLGAWLTTPELARLLGMAPGTVRGWSTGHRPRPGFELERLKDGASVWWRVSDATD
jgi:hypothetical protein